MFSLAKEDEVLLTSSMQLGEAVLVLGAGASYTSENTAGEHVKQGDELAKVLSERAGLEYGGESLPVVLTAVRGNILSDMEIWRVYEREFKGIKPSYELESIFKYAWRRIYTWSIDDALDNIITSRVQRPRYFNGIKDSAVDSEDPSNIQIVKLHGDIGRFDVGVIMSEAEYAAAISGGRHAWYQKAAQDYISYTPIFIGTRLAEPILAAELARAQRGKGISSGRAFLITPDILTPIQKASFEARGIVHICATLADFVNWLSKSFPNGLSPREILRNTNQFTGRNALESLSESDLSIARSLFPLNMSELSTKASARNVADRDKYAKQFLRGAPPTWDIASSDIPVWLSPANELHGKLQDAISRRDRLFMVLGQSGSGKSTAVMQSLNVYGKAAPEAVIYELRGEVRSLRQAFSLLARLHDGHVILYIADLFVLGDSFAEDLLSIDAGRITVISTARSGEWSEHFEYYLRSVASISEFSRFSESDYRPLIEKLLSYVPSPSFKKLSDGDRLRKFASSKNQLLIALREATESQNFTDVITNEFDKLPDDDTKLLLLIVALATISRVGISVGAAREAYSRVSSNRTFEAAESALDGIVIQLANGRLFARHELYVRHIVDNVVELKWILDCLIAIAKNFIKYPVPVVKNINRVDSHLFRFVFNHDFILTECKRRSMPHDGERLYSNFEIDFQLDGHFWLQYGLYMADRGQTAEAVTMLERSIQAYPSNAFAVHALAELQLQLARGRSSYDSVTVQLIGDSVKTLLELDARTGIEHDQYPIITLATLHVGALIKHGQLDAAKTAATNYYYRLHELERTGGSARLTHAKERVFKYATLGEWERQAEPRNGKSGQFKGRRRGRP